MKNAPPPAKRVILAGAGHAHLYVAARAEDFRERDVEVVLVDPGAFWYSGLATGMLAGQLPPEADQVDPKALITRHGGTFLRDRVNSVDARNRRVALSSGTLLEYDLLSLNLGSRVRLPFPGAKEHVIPVKPIRDLWDIRIRLEHRFADSPGRPPELIVLGGGPTGCEIAACAAALAKRKRAEIKVRLLTPGERVMSGFPWKVSKRMTRELERRGIEVATGSRAVEIRDDAVVDDVGRCWRAEYLVAATGLEATDLVRDSGLPVTPDGSLRINGTLQTIADPRVFAAGDCATLEGHPLPKLGVFGVRQAPVLHRNLLNVLDDEPLEAYTPQTRWLMILNLGDGHAMAVYAGRSFVGRPASWLKHFIDRRFLRKYR